MDRIIPSAGAAVQGSRCYPVGVCLDGGKYLIILVDRPKTQNLFQLLPTGGSASIDLRRLVELFPLFQVPHSIPNKRADAERCEQQVAEH